MGEKTVRGENKILKYTFKRNEKEHRNSDGRNDSKRPRPLTFGTRARNSKRAEDANGPQEQEHHLVTCSQL
jgi:hypothetical protein